MFCENELQNECFLRELPEYCAAQNNVQTILKSLRESRLINY